MSIFEISWTRLMLINSFQAGVDIDAGVFTKEMSDRSTQRWDEIIDALALPIELQRADWRSLTGPRANNNCIMCKLVAKKILSMRQNGLDAEKIQEEMGTLCTRFNVQTEHVCHGLVKLNAVSNFRVFSCRLREI